MKLLVETNQTFLILFILFVRCLSECQVHEAQSAVPVLQRERLLCRLGEVFRLLPGLLVSHDCHMIVT